MNFSIGNLSSQPVIVEKVINVKDMCYGLVGLNTLLLVLLLIGINFIVMIYWKKLIDQKIKWFGRETDLLYLLPVINGCILVIIFFYVYNIF